MLFDSTKPAPEVRRCDDAVVLEKGAGEGRDSLAGPVFNPVNATNRGDGLPLPLSLPRALSDDASGTINANRVGVDGITLGEEPSDSCHLSRRFG